MVMTVSASMAMIFWSSMPWRREKRVECLDRGAGGHQQMFGSEFAFDGGIDALDIGLETGPFLVVGANRAGHDALEKDGHDAA